MTPDFVHLHSHTVYSKFDGLASIKNIKRDGKEIAGVVSTAKAMNMKALAITDHGTFAGAIAFLQECRAQQIKPILGIETYHARDHRAKTTSGEQDAQGNSTPSQPDGRKGNRHLILLAKNKSGFRNICALSQIASLEGYYYDPRIDYALLEKHSDGVICTSACLKGIINWNLLIDRYEQAKQAATLFKDIFGDDFYLEMMYHGIDREGKILPDIQKLGKELNIKVIASNDNHYVSRDEGELHQLAMCLSSGRLLKDPSRLHAPYDEFYFKSQADMAKIFGHIPSVMRNTLEIAEKCDYSDIVLGGQMLLPHFKLPEGHTDPHEYLSKLAWAGLSKNQLDKSPQHRERLERELSDLKLVQDTKGYDFATYLLIIEDMIHFMKDNDIDYGIRGSGFGSLIVKCLGISEGVDPLEQELMWERFLGFDTVKFISEADLGLKSK
jgi:DNA polymerase-3 subunit alpha